MRKKSTCVKHIIRPGVRWERFTPKDQSPDHIFETIYFIRPLIVKLKLTQTLTRKLSTEIKNNFYPLTCKNVLLGLRWSEEMNFYLNVYTLELTCYNLNMICCSLILFSTNVPSHFIVLACSLYYRVRMLNCCCI